MKNQRNFLWGIALIMAFNVAGIRGECDCSCSPAPTSTTDGCGPKTLWFGRSAGDNLVLDQHRFGYQHHEDCCSYGDFSMSYRHQESVKGRRLAESLFGTNILSFAGSQATSRTAKTVAANTLLADYFGLAQDTDNLSISFCPEVKNDVLDFKLYIGIDELCEGLYVQFNAPLVHTKWSLNGCKDGCGGGNGGNGGNGCCNSCCTPGCITSNCYTTTGINGCITGNLSQTVFPAGYMGSYYQTGVTPATVNPITPNSSLADALNGFAFGGTYCDFQGRSYGKFSGLCSDTKFAGFYCDLGYNVVDCPDYHLGAYLKIVAPTGTDMDSDNHVVSLFYPVIGDFHWQLGAGISGHTELYCCEDSTLSAYIQGYVTHLFAREHVRAFDLTNGPMSRYMLMKEFKSTTDQTYNDKLWSVIDWSTRRAKVKVDAKGEALIEFIYTNNCGFSAGIGYELYGRSREKICKPCNDPVNSSLRDKVLGLKGCTPVDAPLYGLAANVVQAGVINSYREAAYPANKHGLGSTQSNATAYTCGTVDNKVALVDAVTNNVVYSNPLTYPNPVGLAGTTVAVEDSATGTVAISGVGAVTNLTANPVLLSNYNLDRCSAELKGYITNKVFGHIDYTFDECNWKPVIYAGAEGEFASCSDKNAMNAWGFWLGGGVAF
ncbi:TPA: hypothetical protein DDZ86_03445 [Candidatus Dependentiae bacterium]|nr:MAG: hypothetical protein UW09_C0003G0042 [candidate division TM6 bacterium GW2011_GWF2_43_87]HBL98670.1 hypothetical protein [Candidatus Dependentiae bacterium]